MRRDPDARLMGCRRLLCNIIALAPLLLFASSAGAADLDEELSTLRRTYGDEASREQIYHPLWHEVEFSQGLLSVVCYVDPGDRVRAVTYYRQDRRLTAAEIEKLRANNAAGSGWSKHPSGTAVELRDAPPMPWQDTWRDIWRRDDGKAVAVVDDDGWVYFRTSSWLKVLLQPAPEESTTETQPDR